MLELCCTLSVRCQDQFRLKGAMFSSSRKMLRAVLFLKVFFFFTGVKVLSVQKILSRTGLATRKLPVYFPIRRSLPAWPEPDNIFWTDITSEVGLSNSCVPTELSLELSQPIYCLFERLYFTSLLFLFPSPSWAERLRNEQQNTWPNVPNLS